MRTLPLRGPCGLFVLAMCLVGCSSDSTTEPQLQTSCPFICDCDISSCTMNISCESGSHSTEYRNESTSYDYDDSGRRVMITMDLNRVWTFMDTGNAYTITGTIEWDLVASAVDWNIQAAGGAYGNTPQTCNGSKSF